ncbi:MAG: hypothetical protein O2927_02145, partial [Planctomycetota bacterium]|nr:hypothetical protein [Planctomycetota bacterium]
MTHPPSTFGPQSTFAPQRPHSPSRGSDPSTTAPAPTGGGRHRCGSPTMATAMLIASATIATLPLAC